MHLKNFYFWIDFWLPPKASITPNIHSQKKDSLYTYRISDLKKTDWLGVNEHQKPKLLPKFLKVHEKQINEKPYHLHNIKELWLV